jgi:hypothetical protein
LEADINVGASAMTSDSWKSPLLAKIPTTFHVAP